MKRVPVRRTSNLSRLCTVVTSMESAFEDVEDQIEARAYADCRDGKIAGTVKALSQLADFFEDLENKNEENFRDLGRLYLLIGEILQTFDRSLESIEWFQKAGVVNERNPNPFQNLARSYAAVGEVDKAIRCLEQEIALAPGNYFSYLMLADLLEKRGETAKVEALLDRLLQRDPDNIQALAHLIKHHRATHPGLDVEFLRRRLLSVQRPMGRKDLLTWGFHMCEEGRAEEVVGRAMNGHGQPTEPSALLMGWYAAGACKKRTEQRLCMERFGEALHGQPRSQEHLTEEFSSVFGAAPAKVLRKEFSLAFSQRKGRATRPQPKLRRSRTSSTARRGS